MLSGKLRIKWYLIYFPCHAIFKAGNSVCFTARNLLPGQTNKTQGEKRKKTSPRLSSEMLTPWAYRCIHVKVIKPCSLGLLLYFSLMFCSLYFDLHLSLLLTSQVDQNAFDFLYTTFLLWNGSTKKYIKLKFTTCGVIIRWMPV